MDDLLSAFWTTFEKLFLDWVAITIVMFHMFIVALPTIILILTFISIVVQIAVGIKNWRKK